MRPTRSDPATGGPAPIRTWDVVAALFDTAGARTLAQLTTQSTSREFPPQMANLAFDRNELVVTRTPEYEPYGAATHLPMIGELPGLLPGEQFDVVFADPWHTMCESRLALRWAIDHVAPGGWLVVHDCWPHQPELLGPYRGSGSPWCGDTGWAFQELARAQGNPWCVIDDDFGIGVIGPVVQTCPAPAAPGAAPDAAQQWDWLLAHRDAPWLVTPQAWFAELQAAHAH